MKAVLDFFGAIGNSIKAVVEAIVAAVQFVVDFFADLVYVITITGDALVTAPELLKWLPAGVSAVIITILTLAVLYKIMGREG